MPGLRTAPDESGFKLPSGSAVPSPAIHRRAGEAAFETPSKTGVVDFPHRRFMGRGVPGGPVLFLRGKGLAVGVVDNDPPAIVILSNVKARRRGSSLYLHD